MTNISIGKISVGLCGVAIVGLLAWAFLPGSSSTSDNRACLSPNDIAPETAGMKFIPGGAFDMGPTEYYAEKSPVPSRGCRELLD